MEPMEMETTLPQGAEPAANPGASGDVGGIAAAIESQHVAPAATTGGGNAPKRIGRPPKHGLYSKAMGSDGKNPVRPPGPNTGPVVRPAAVAPDQVESGGGPRVQIPADLLAKIVKETVDWGERFATNKVEGAAVKAGLTAPEIGPQLEQCKLGERRKEVVADLAPLVAEEWGLDAEMSPTVAVVAVLAPWAFAATSAFKTLETLAKEKAAKQPGANAA